MALRSSHCIALTLPHWGLGILLLAASACASPYRQVELGSAQANIGLGTTESAVAVLASGDRYQINFHIMTSDATEVQIDIRCPGGAYQATVGESMASYRERRLRELQYARERQEQERTRAAAAVGAAVSTVATVQAPGVSVEAEVQVEAAALAVGTAAPVQLGPYDRGAQSIHQTVLLPGGEAGQCRMSLLPIAGGPQLAGVTGYMQVTHIVDRERERQQVRVAANQSALKFRATIKADLITRGADPELRRKLQLAQDEKERLAYEANQVLVEEANRKQREARVAEQARNRELALQARAEARARDQRERPIQVPRATVAVTVPKVQVELHTEVDVYDQAVVAAALALESEQRRTALQLRKRLVALCISGGADIYYRARRRQEAFDTQQREERAYQVRVQADADAEIEAASRRKLQLIADLGTRETLVAWLIAGGADPEYRRKQNEADLSSFEERARSAHYQAQLDAQAETVLPSALPGDLNVHVHTRSGVATGVTSIPAKPSAPREARPPAPSAASSWIAGFYEYRANAWVWVPGIWSTPPVADAVWVPSIEVRLGGQLITRPGSWRTSHGKRVRSKPAAATPRVRDHRR